MTQTAQPKTTQNPIIHIELNSGAEISGVSSVTETDEREISAMLGNKALSIIGDKLNIDLLDVENGRLKLSGNVHEVKIADKLTPKGFFKKLLK